MQNSKSAFHARLLRLTLGTILTLAALIAARPAHGQFTHNFLPTTGSNLNFGTAANWSAGTVPGSASAFVRLNNPPGDSSGASVLLSTQSDVALGGFEMKSVGGQAAPQWQRQIPDEVAAVVFMVLPVGWVGEWHESPRPQWVVPATPLTAPGT